MDRATSVKIAASFGMILVSGCFTGPVYREERVYRPAPPPPERVVIERRETVREPERAPVVVEERVIEEDRPSEVVVTTFYEDLAPHGRWVMIGNYGRCWRPERVDRSWRPYTVGHWVHTEYGLTWESDEPWGYSTYHYGRWFDDARYGWVWMPGSTWAPAWVAWRSGGGYMGWAPLGPSVHDRYDVRVTEIETREIPASHFCFVEERHIAEPRIHEHVVSAPRNTTIINNTTNITNITVVNNTVVNKSVTVEHMERATGHKVHPVVVKQVTTAAEAKRYRDRGEPVQYRPPVLAEAQKRKTAETKAQQIQRETQQPKSSETKAQPETKAQQLEREARERAERVKRRERDARLDDK